MYTNDAMMQQQGAAQMQQNPYNTGAPTGAVNPNPYNNTYNQQPTYYNNVTNM